MSDEADADHFNAAFERAMKGGEAKPLNLTQEEAEKFQKCFHDPEFRKLFADYMDEISDPKARAEQEQYITQLEEEKKVPEDKELIRPQPGFVIKSHKQDEKPADAKKDKLFVNIVQSDKVAAPSSSKAPPGKSGLQWNLPHCLGPVRMEADKGGSNTATLDCCFHPDTVRMAQTNPRFRELVATSALDTVQAWFANNGQKVKVDPEFKVLKGIAHKPGQPPTMMISKAKKDDWSKAPPPSSAPSPPPPAVKPPATTTRDRPAKAVTPCDPPAKLPSSVPPERASGPREPEYQVTERGVVDLADHMMADAGPPRSRRPKELVIKIQLPLIKGASELELDLSERRLLLSSGSSYRLDLRLPYPVLDEKSAAKFDKQKKTLTVTIPVQPPPPPPPRPIHTDASSPSAEDTAPVLKEGEEHAEAEAAAPPATSRHQSAPPAAAGAGHERWVSEADKAGEQRLVLDKEEVARAVEEAKRKMAAEVKPKAQPGAAANAGQEADRAAPVDWSWFDPTKTYNAAKAFVGARPGHVFKLGQEGLGYYRDAHAAASSQSADDPAVERPAFRFQQQEASFSLIVSVSGIDPASVKAVWGGESRKQVELSFEARPAAGSSMRKCYRLSLSLLHEIKADQCKFDVASTNMLVVLVKDKPGLWLSLEDDGKEKANGSQHQEAHSKKGPEKVGLPAVESKSSAPVKGPGGVQQFRNRMAMQLD